MNEQRTSDPDDDSDPNYAPYCAECHAYSEPHEPTCSKYVRTSNQRLAEAERLLRLCFEQISWWDELNWLSKDVDTFLRASDVASVAQDKS